MALSSLKEELDTWDSALTAYDAGDFTGSLSIFERIAGTSKVAMNVGLIHMHLGTLSLATENLSEAVRLDNFLAIGYFQRAVCYYRMNKMGEAYEDFCSTEVLMRGNDVVYYRELGLQFELHADKVLLNRGLTLIQLGKEDEGHDLVLKAGAQEGDELFAMPDGLLFRPPSSKRLFLSKYENAMSSSAASTSTSKPLFSPLTNDIEIKTDYSSTYAPSIRTNNRRVSASSSVTEKVTHSRSGSTNEKHDRFLSSPSPSPSSATTATPIHLRTDLAKVLGPDLLIPTTEISTIPCAGIRIASGNLIGLMGWRLIVDKLDDREDNKHRTHSQTLNRKRKREGKIRLDSEWTTGKRQAVVGNFILDTGSAKTVVSQELLRVVGYKGDYRPGTEIKHLRIQGIPTQCIIGLDGEASRLGGQFMTSGNLTFYFDNKLNAPVLYVGDESNERPSLSTILRTVLPMSHRGSRTRMPSPGDVVQKDKPHNGVHRNNRKSFRESVYSVMGFFSLMKGVE